MFSMLAFHLVEGEMLKRFRCFLPQVEFPELVFSRPAFFMFVLAKPKQYNQGESSSTRTPSPPSLAEFLVKLALPSIWISSNLECMAPANTSRMHSLLKNVLSKIEKRFKQN